MKAPIFSAYAPNRTAAVATLNTLASTSSTDEQPAPEACNHCGGSGWWTDPEANDCPHCYGTGTEPKQR